MKRFMKFDNGEWLLRLPGWNIGRDKWGWYAVRAPWGRFGVPGDRNHYRRLPKVFR